MSIFKNKIENLNNSHQIILFDGSCSFCNWSVNFVLKRDPKKVFLFSSLQSNSSIEYLATKEKKLQEVDSILLIKHGEIYTKSTAALKIAKQLKGPIKLIYIFNVIPKVIRDFIYDFIAKKRHHLFKQEYCIIPSEEEKQRIIS